MLSIKHAQTGHEKSCALHMPSVGWVYNARPSCFEGPGECPTPPQADPLLTTHLLGVPVLAGKSRGRSTVTLLLRYATPLMGYAIIIPLSNLRPWSQGSG